MADDGNFIAPIEEISRIYECIKNEGPAYGLHIQESKTKIWWPKITSSRLKEFDCNVLHDEKGKLDAGITHLRGSFRAPRTTYVRISKSFRRK